MRPATPERLVQQRAATFIAKKRMPSAPSARRPEDAEGAGRAQAGQKNRCNATPLLRSGSSLKRCLLGDQRVLKRCRHRVCLARRHRATRWTRPPWSVPRLAGVWRAFGGRLASAWRRAKDLTSAPGRDNPALEGRIAEITARCRRRMRGNSSAAPLDREHGPNCCGKLKTRHSDKAGACD